MSPYRRTATTRKATRKAPRASLWRWLSAWRRGVFDHLARRESCRKGVEARWVQISQTCMQLRIATREEFECARRAGALIGPPVTDDDLLEMIMGLEMLAGL